MFRKMRLEFLDDIINRLGTTWDPQGARALKQGRNIGGQKIQRRPDQKGQETLKENQNGDKHLMLRLASTRVTEKCHKMVSRTHH